MTPTSRLLAGAAAILVVFVGGVLLLRPAPESGVGGSSPSLPPALSSPSARAELDRTFTSDRYGFSVGYPAAWTTFPASRSWTASEENLWDSGINDELKGTDVRFSGAAQALASGQTADDWVRESGSPVGALAGQGSGPETWPTVTIDGVQGWIDIDGGVASGGVISAGGRIFDAIVVSGGYGFNFDMDGNVDRAMFDALLASVKLPALPDLDQRYASARAGYSIGHPGDWTVTPAPKSWTSGYETRSVSDHIGSVPSIDGTSMKLPAGMTFDAYFAAYDADRTKGTCSLPSRNEDITIDGAVGHLDVHCPGKYIEAVVSKGGRVYVFTMFPPYSRPLFETLLASVRLTPATAKN